MFSLAFSPDCSSLLAGGGDGKLRLWDVPSGRQRFAMPAHNPPEIYGVAFAPKGDWLISGGFDGRVAVWDAHTGAELGSFFQPCLRAFAVSPDSRLVASVGATGAVRSTNPDYGLIVWETATREERFRVTTGKIPIWSVAYSPDGTRIAIGETINGVRLFDAEGGRQIAFVPSDHMGGLAFSPDGKSLAMQGPGTDILLLDAATGRQAAQFPTSHSRDLTCLAFSNNGKWLASGSGDSSHAGEVIIADATTGKEATTLRRHSKGITAVTFSRDGRYLATAGRDGTAQVWDLDQVLGQGR